MIDNVDPMMTKTHDKNSGFQVMDEDQELPHYGTQAE